MHKKRNLLPIICTLLIVAVMVYASELAHEKEIIFPEIAAIAVGALLSPTITWHTDKKRILILIMVCASLGMTIVFVVPGTLWLKFVIAYAVSQIILSLSGTGFAPMVSAIVLPVMLGTRTPLYLLSAFLFTTIILLVRTVFEKTSVCNRISYQPLERQPFVFLIKKIMVASVIIFIAIITGFPYVVAPPVLVAFTEFAYSKSAARPHPFKTVSLISLCALSGTFCRYTITSVAGLPLTLAAVLAMTISIILIYSFRMYLPPAGALTLLAMLIPRAALAIYPVSVFAGVSIFMLISGWVFRSRAYSNK